jgi:hypothetical protein
VGTSSLGGLLTVVRAAALLAAPAAAAATAAGPLSGSYLCLYPTFTVLTSMDKFRNLYALLVVYLWLWMNDITLYLDLRFM